MRKLLLFVLTLALLAAPALADSGEVLCTLPTALPSMSAEHPGSDDSYLGCVTADAVRAAAGADIALVNSGDMVRDLPSAVVTREDVDSVFEENRTLAVVQLTPAQLTRLLEYALSHITVVMEEERIDREASHFDGFLQLSGLQLKYDASAPAGERVYSLTLDASGKLDREDDSTLLTVAATAHMLDGGYGFPPVEGYRVLDMGLADALAEWISPEHLPSDITRVTSLGTVDSSIVSGFPMILVIPVLLAVIILLALLSGKRKNFRFMTKPMKRGEASRYLSD